MPTAEAVAFFPLATAAASVAVWHTLAGPDHYLPLIAIGKARRWSLRRAMGITMLCGVAHCLASLVIVAAVLATLCAVGSTASLQVWRSDVAGMLLMGLGAALIIGGLRRKRSVELPVNQDSRGLRSFPWLLFLVFILGPCEWLIPAASTASASHGIWGAMVVSGVFTAVTISTMVASVALGLVGMPQISRSLPAGLMAGVVTLTCGGMMLAGF